MTGKRNIRWRGRLEIDINGLCGPAALVAESGGRRKVYGVWTVDGWWWWRLL
ncbi:hypothetical protein HanXRQr2_Chr15g0675561 [Helianthus annuus]|uniref:Uncharacterized protein n=1 Tax=Helianthus annuus TaxID=4232 RepID=A0A9K3DZ53_HELAN|nr:hypothetical protein HanXRQr2_Chr15g0675561 [Helianthus annuus]KAJ0829824.1 hypothetical protein HanPSC8_Chr15g0648191 [Helianthus annuus]